MEPTQTSCTVPVSKFMTHPYNLRIGDKIYSQVQGRNEAGFGEPSMS
jgi:hypothetical protein